MYERTEKSGGPISCTVDGGKSEARGLNATFILALAVYLLALGGSALLKLRPTALDAVPFCLASAAFLILFSRGASPAAVRFIEVIEAVLAVVALGLGLACLSYVCAAMDLPLRDREMIWIDQRLGFDWLQMMKQLDAFPGLLLLLDSAYATFTFQLIATAVLLLAFAGTRALDRFLLTFICASLIAELASILAPTLGPMASLAQQSHFENLPTLGRTTADIVLALRQGALKEIGFEAVDGIISFPSLHAAVAVIIPVALRRYRPLFWPALALNAVMLLSAIPSGNHYLIDVIAGIGVAVLAIFCAPGLQLLLDRLAAPLRTSGDQTLAPTS
ncbi:MAG TPA: phosphatase PAP2 family protein [Pseudolabrys sp.]|nr:phosphatase PAP2 family protein [Pseudolabrys sp.]